MKEQTATFVIETIEAHFGQRFSEQALKAIGPGLLQEPDAAMEQAGDYIVLNFPANKPPTPARLLDLVREFGKKIRIQEAKVQDEKQGRGKPEEQPHDLASIKTRDERDKRCLDFLKVIANRDTYTREMLIEGSRHMENQYPGLGYGLEAIRSQAIFDKIDRANAARESAKELARREAA